VITIYRPSDKVPVKIGEFTFYVCPLTLDQKGTINSFGHMEGGEFKADPIKVTKAYLKYSLKGFEGPDVCYPDGSKFELKFDESGLLSDQSIEEIACLDQIIGLIKVITSWIVQNRVYDPKIKGVEVVLSGQDSAKKKPVSA